MNIENRNNVSFKAVKINTVNLPQKINGKWKKAEAIFIKLNPRDTADMAAIEGVTKRWNGRNMSNGILEEVNIYREPVYGLTLQKNELEKPEVSKILGLFTTGKIKKDTEAAEIFKLGVSPSCAYEQNKRKREIKHVGSTMIKEFVKILQKNKKIEKLVIGSEDESYKFYERLKLEKAPDSYGVFQLPREKFKDFINS